ncbi:MAG: hypothetical protein ACTSQY_09940 [Candidatus Odinarchaeia archaeon]
MVIGFLWQLAKDIKKHADRPQLVIESLRAENFRLLRGEYYCRFLLARISNFGGIRAENCLGHLVLNEDHEEEFKLHWADESWEKRRDSAPKIDLEPTESRDLDIAFSLCGNRKPDYHLTSDEGPIIYPNKQPVTEPPHYTGGTFDPMGVLGTTSATSENLRFRNIFEPLEGSWIASPRTPLELTVGSITYLKPGVHNVELRLILSEGEGFVLEFDILSSKDPYELTIIQDSVNIIP